MFTDKILGKTIGIAVRELNRYLVAVKHNTFKMHPTTIKVSSSMAVLVYFVTKGQMLGAFLAKDLNKELNRKYTVDFEVYGDP